MVTSQKKNRHQGGTRLERVNLPWMWVCSAPGRSIESGMLWERGLTENCVKKFIRSWVTNGGAAQWRKRIRGCRSTIKKNRVIGAASFTVEAGEVARFEKGKIAS